jgi:GNAT superfamily N-acetyltransferase
LSPRRGLPAGFRLVARPIPAGDYLRLRRAVGWTELDPATAERGLAGALFAVVLEKDGAVVGCGQVVGDGAVYFYIQDVIVEEACRGLGLGDAIMARLMAWVGEHAGRGSFIGLMAARGVAGFYERLGFVRRDPEAPGMCRYWHGEETP